MMESLSAILIAHNEESDIAQCLKSLHDLATEIIVVISIDTKDRTEEIARQYHATVIRRQFDNYAAQRQAGLEAASGNWCLWIDPDERVSQELSQEIKSTLNSSSLYAGYRVPFEIEFCGQILRWGGLGSEKHLRLFKRNCSKFMGGSLHESISVDGKISQLNGKISHRPYRDLSDYFSKLNRYTTLAAQTRFATGKRFHVWHHLLLIWDFFSRVVLKFGFLDGLPGIVWAGLSAFHRWLKYVKLAALERNIKL